MSYSILEDNELMDKVRLSDERAFDEIYRRYWRKLYALSLYHLRDSNAAEDIVQEIFVSLWASRERSEIKHLYTYLATATKYSIFHYFAQPARNTDSLEELHTLAADHSTADTRFLEEEIRREIDRLPEKCRLVFRYSREEGLANKIISEKLNISTKAVEKHMTRALRQLRVQFKHMLMSLLF
ncbi:RNA polymerase sigma-70 factor [Chitinophaga ginsengisoli]|uniref:RNA polymerase sigma-70 factor (ECF subfamily) n=1 Tax=Chitinophaga ginsengisoli TaxID=363837 RepID=A0A2P8FNU9_9BACT|nr:RNA polymerase sigma-70 factor [Chitinophaga ginsengisoli]PSL23394.1 RNA polymerase sigma-70 factor (ECF subfamily) [Chitinophaga ginsengisoli]